MIIIVLSVGDRKGRKESSQEARKELSLLSGDASEGRTRRRGLGNRAGHGGLCPGGQASLSWSHFWALKDEWHLCQEQGGYPRYQALQLLSHRQTLRPHLPSK